MIIHILKSFNLVETPGQTYIYIQQCMSSYSCARGYKKILTSSVLVSTDVINLNKYDGLQLTTRLPAKNGPCVIA